jgi:hypothetical protein
MTMTLTRENVTISGIYRTGGWNQQQNFSDDIQKQQHLNVSGGPVESALPVESVSVPPLVLAPK